MLGLDNLSGHPHLATGNLRPHHLDLLRSMSMVRFVVHMSTYLRRNLFASSSNCSKAEKEVVAVKKSPVSQCMSGIM